MTTDSRPLDRLEAVLAAATPGRWFWEATGPNPGDMTLSRETGETDDDPHILTPHVCESCHRTGNRCLAPRTENARAITAAVNLAPSLLAVVKAARDHMAAVDSRDRADADWMACTCEEDLSCEHSEAQDAALADFFRTRDETRAALDNLHSAITQEVGE